MARKDPIEFGDHSVDVVWAANVPPLDLPVEVAPGIFWVRTKLPFALDHINLWLLDDGDGWTAIDAGYGDAATQGLWEKLLAGLLAKKPLSRLIVTHFHPDHLGQAGWLAKRTGAPMYMTRTEWLTGRMLSLDTSPEFLDAGEEQDRRAGLESGLIAERRSRGNLYRRGVTPIPAKVELVRGGDVLRIGGSDWRVIIGEGHAPEQITLFSAERRILIGADQLLPRITPVVGLWTTTPELDPLGNFVACLQRFDDLPVSTLVLPSHERPYRGIHPRLAQLREHHESRLETTLEACHAPSRAIEVMRRLFTRALDSHQLGFAVAETLAHLRALEQRRNVRVWLDDDGAMRWQRV